MTAKTNNLRPKGYRPYRVEDIPKIVEYGKQVFAESSYATAPYSPEAFTHALVEGLTDPDFLGLAAVDQNDTIVGGIVGYIRPMFFSDVRMACDVVIYLHPSYSNVHTLKELVKGLETWGKLRKAFFVMFLTSSQIRTKGLDRAYKMLGYDNLGSVWRKTIGE